MVEGRVIILIILKYGTVILAILGDSYNVWFPVEFKVPKEVKAEVKFPKIPKKILTSFRMGKATEWRGPGKTHSASYDTVFTYPICMLKLTMYTIDFGGSYIELQLSAVSNM